MNKHYFIIGIILLMSIGIATAIDESKILTYYDFNNNTNDVYSGIHNATMVSNLNYVDGKYNKALYFDGGSDSYLLLANPITLHDKSYGISIWYKGTGNPSNWNPYMAYWSQNYPYLLASETGDNATPDEVAQ